VGDPTCIRMTWGSMLDFKMSVVMKEVTRSQLALRDPYPYGGTGFWVDGRNCRSPGGQGHLVVPTSEIEEWLKRNPMGCMNWR